MKPEKQRIAIAEYRGYIRQSPDSPWFDHPTEGQVHEDDLPDCLNSLDAMHEAEKRLSDKEKYLHFLRMIATEDPLNRSNEPAFTTAAQRADAFLRTVGRWEE